MSRTRAARNRREAQKKSANNRNLVTIVAGLIIVGTIALIFASSNTSGSSAAADNPRLDLDPIMGNPDAPVTIVEYGAYACPSCRAWHQAGIIEDILAAYPDQVRFIFRDFPVIVPAYDRMAAEVAQCALDQSQAGFWALHNALYETIQVGTSSDQIVQVGQQLGLDGVALQSCVDANTHTETVQYDFDRARSLALPGTPSFLVNDQRIFNASPDVLVAAVEEALAAS